MADAIQSILDNVIGDGARSAKFECFLHFGMTELFDGALDAKYMVKTSQFPGKTHEVIDLKYKGRTIPIKGQTKYDNTWTCTFYLTQDHNLKTSFENWIESIDQKHNIKEVSKAVKKAQGTNSDSGYTTTLKIYQQNFHNDDDLVEYELLNCFPKSVSAVDVDYSDVGSILEFTVEFSFSHYNVKKSTDVETSIIEDISNFVSNLGF